MAFDTVVMRERLEAERTRLLNEITEMPIEPPEPMTYGSQAAAASQVFDQNRARALRERAQRELEQVNTALARLENGTYGLCAACSQPIDPERLEALPWALYDLDCQRKVR
jgi:RNA polymerase-binding transcription factor DksA